MPRQRFCLLYIEHKKVLFSALNVFQLLMNTYALKIFWPYGYELKNNIYRILFIFTPQILKIAVQTIHSLIRQSSPFGTLCVYYIGRIS